MNITKIELCNRVAQRFGDVPVSELKPILEAFLDEILDALSEGRKIEFRGFGTFVTKVRKSRVGRNPRTGESVDIPEYTAPVFKFSKDAQKTFETKQSIVEKRHKTAFKSRKVQAHKKNGKDMGFTAEDIQETQDQLREPKENKNIDTESSAENFSPA